MPGQSLIDQRPAWVRSGLMEDTKALIIGSSGGIGRALFAECALRYGPGNVAGLSRSNDGLEVRDEASIAATLDMLPDRYDLVVVATGALAIDGTGPEKSLRQLSAKSMRDQFEVNTIGPALILKHAVNLLRRDRRAVVAVLSARVGSIGDNRLGGWYSYRAAKAALNQIVHSAAIEIARSHRQAICVVLHPGTVATPLTSDFVDSDNATPPDRAARNLLDVIEGLTQDQSGGFLDYAGQPVGW